MFDTFPSVWMLLLLPFASAGAIMSVPPLSRLSSACRWLTWPLGIAGLGALIAGLTGVLSPDHALLVIVIGGALSGFAVFWPSPGDQGDGGDDWRQWDPPPDPPPGPGHGVALDWERFDHLRAEWEQTRADRNYR